MEHRPTSDGQRVYLITHGKAQTGDIYLDFCHCPGCHKILNAELCQYGGYPSPWAWCAACRIGVRMVIEFFQPRYVIVNMNKADD